MREGSERGERGGGGWGPSVLFHPPTHPPIDPTCIQFPHTHHTHIHPYRWAHHKIVAMDPFGHVTTVRMDGYLVVSFVRACID